MKKVFILILILALTTPLLSQSTPQSGGLSLSLNMATIHGDDIPKSIDVLGQKGVLCPARHDVPGKKDITCNDCTLCKVTDKTKDIVVMFEVHGPPKTKKEATEKSVDINELR